MKSGQQVNYVFGEGMNPRLRIIRDGLEEMGLCSDTFLQHGGPRLVYGATLVHNLRAYLLGREKRPRYVLPQGQPGRMTAALIDWWRRRWLSRRLERDDVFERIASHTLVYPVRHGARVCLPRLDPEQPELFDDADV